MEKLNLQDIFEIFKGISSKMSEKRDELISIDSLMGDGDLGITMDTGFKKIVEETSKYAQEKNIGKTLMKLGFAMANTVPSSMGTIVATAIMKSSASVKEKEEINLNDCVQMLNDAIKGIENIGKSKRGEKTILDSLYPAKEKLETAVSEGLDMKSSFKSALQGAAAGAQDTKAMKAVHGRAARFNEDSIGKQDAGATVAMYIFEAVYESININK